MLQPDALKQVMMDAVHGMTAEDNPLSAMGEAIADYIMANAVITFAWNGIWSDPVPPLVDGTVVATGEILELGITLTAAGVNDHAVCMQKMAQEIITGMKGAMYNITLEGFSTTPLSMATAPTIDALVLEAAGEGFDTPFLNLATQIITWVKGLLPPAPVQGAHGDYTAPAGTGGTVSAIN